jgi:hypothetical protein
MSYFLQMHLFSFRVGKIAPACTEKYIIEVSEICDFVFLSNTRCTVDNAAAVFPALLLSIRIHEN